MMKFACLLLLVVFSCGKKEEAAPEQAGTTTDTVAPATDPTPGQKLVGGDGDAHGCKTSAGYTWSVLEKNCVRIFEKGTRLDPYDDPQHMQMSAFVIFKGDSAELFVPSEKAPPILVRKSQGAPFEGSGWQLVPWKGYVLKQHGKILFTGK